MIMTHDADWYFIFSADEEFDELCFDFGLELDDVVRYTLLGEGGCVLPNILVNLGNAYMPPPHPPDSTFSLHPLLVLWHSIGVFNDQCF